MPGQSETGGNNDPGNVITHFGAMVAGWGMKSHLGIVLGASFYIGAIAIGLWNKKTRILSAILLIGPYALASLIAVFLAPMYKTPVYSSMLVPFACLVLAGGLTALKTSWAPWLMTLLLASMSIFVFPASQRLLETISPYKPVVAELKSHVLAGDVVVVPKPYMYWAVMRYAVGPNWGSPLEILPALNENWKNMLGKLDPDLRTALKLVPKSDHVVHEGITYVIGDDAYRDSVSAKRVWVIQRVSYKTSVRLSDGFLDKGIQAEFGNREITQLQLYERP